MRRVSQPSPRDRRLAALFVASGFTALAYQVLLSRYVQLVSGVTAYAISALLVAFLLGMAIGSWLGGRWADRVALPLRFYAVAEGLVGLYCLSFPLLFPVLQQGYLALVGRGAAAALGPDTLRFLLGVSAFLVPSLLIGATTPAFARAVTARGGDSAAQLVRLYGWNTLGGALGALLTAYWTVPVLGMRGGLALMALLNALVCAGAWRWAEPVAPPSGGSTAPAGDVAARRAGVWALLAVAFGTGFATFALEVTWTHLLAVLIGNSVYAFGLMLGCLLLGLYLASLLARGLVRRRGGDLDGIGLSLCGASLAVLGTLGLWDRAPRIFLLLSAAGPTFLLLESVRFVVCLALMGLPTVLLGTAFPLILSRAGKEAGVASRVGRLYAVNTVGAVLGAVLAPYVLLRQLGSLESLRLLGCLVGLFGALGLVGLGRQRLRLALAGTSVAVVALGWGWPVRWDLGQLSSAASIYLGRSESASGRLAFVREDPTGGLVTVVERAGVKTLLTNGKFEGDDDAEVPVQHRLANIPTLFTAGRERALVIGLGSGVTLAALAAHGFEETVCAEISRPIVEAARREFSHVNGGVAQGRPGVRLVLEDGRTLLAERPERYDVVSVEVTTIWFAGVGNVYSREFYGSVARRLRQGGVLLQWFPAHHLSPRNLYLVVNTVRSVFPYVSVWMHRHQGFVVASLQPQAVDLRSVREDQARPAMQPFLAELESGSPLQLLSDLVVSDRDADRFLDSMAELLYLGRDVVSTDTWPTLEYETPRDVLAHFSYFQNRGLLARFRSQAPPPLRGQPTREEAALARAAFVRDWDRSALTSLASAWDETRGQASIASWMVDVVGPSPQGAGPSPPLADLLSLAGGSWRCAPPGPPLRPSLVPLRLGRVAGRTLRGSPEAVIDLNSSPDLGRGFWAGMAGGHPVEIELEVDGPQVSAVELALEVPPGEEVIARLLGRGRDGRWRPLGRGRVAAGDCAAWRLELPRPTALQALRVAFQASSPGADLGLHEIRVEP